MNYTKDWTDLLFMWSRDGRDSLDCQVRCSSIGCAGRRRKLHYLASLLADSEPMASRADDEIAVVVGWLISGQAGWLSHVYAPTVPLTLATSVIGSMVPFFEQVVAERTAGGAGGGGASGAIVRLSSAWWESVDLVARPTSRRYRQVDGAILKAQEAILRIDSEVCWLSALHGLNHWSRGYRMEVAEVVDRFLGRCDVPETIRAYAEEAKAGRCL